MTIYYFFTPLPKVCSMVLLLFVNLLCSGPATAKETHFSPSVNITENQQSKILNLTGTAKRSVLFFKVYSLAHYVADFKPVSNQESAVFDEIINAETTKQISMVFSRDLKASQIREKLSSGVEDNCVDDEFNQVKTDLDVFKQVINQNVKKNDEFVLRWLAGGNLVMFFNGQQVGEIENPLLARLLWSVWLGPNAVVNRVDLVEVLLDPSSDS